MHIQSFNVIAELTLKISPGNEFADIRKFLSSKGNNSGIKGSSELKSNRGPAYIMSNAHTKFQENRSIGTEDIIRKRIC